MNKIKINQFNLRDTLLGGQSFSWDQIGDYFYGFTQNELIKLKQDQNSIYWQTYPEKDNFDLVKNYLRIDFDYENMLTRIKKDEHINKAIKAYPDLRILKQNFDQTLLSFIMSPVKNINSIRKSIRLLNQKFGKVIKVDGTEFHLFPSTKTLSEAPLNILLETKIGFRAKNLRASAKKLIEFSASNNLKDLNSDAAHKTLKSFPGVGDKVADCVMIFSLGFDNITPLDVWGKRVLIDFYKLNPKMKYAEMKAWLGEYFQGYAGWAGQFLFEYIRNIN
jgi:N-glycosylase/DNA lyase